MAIFLILGTQYTKRRGSHDIWSGAQAHFGRSPAPLPPTAWNHCSEPMFHCSSGSRPFLIFSCLGSAFSEDCFHLPSPGNSFSIIFLTHSGAAGAALLHGLTSRISEWTRARYQGQAGERHKGQNAFSEHIVGTCLSVFFPTAVGLP